MVRGFYNIFHLGDPQICLDLRYWSLLSSTTLFGLLIIYVYFSFKICILDRLLLIVMFLRNDSKSLKSYALIFGLTTGVIFIFNFIGLWVVRKWISIFIIYEVNLLARRAL